MQFPRMFRVRQTFEGPRLESPGDETRAQLERLQLQTVVRPGQNVAITAGSRGIANIAEITRAIVQHVKALGATPFVVPAMGSHGGGTADGQTAILAGYGITPETMGCDIRSSMETVTVDTTRHGIPVHFDRFAFEADHVIVAGRVKPHTGFVGEIESGLHKMMLIGLGKHEGAKIYHRAIMDYNWPEIVMSVSESVIRKCRILCGVAIVENAYDQTAMIAAVRPAEFFQRECELLVQARNWLPRLPFKTVDLLIIDEIGKNISGSGMDTNVVGRKFNDHKATAQDSVSAKLIFVRGLTEATHGNACGLGMSEFTNERTVRQIDRRITAINAITGNHAPAAAIPIAFETDREVLAASLPMIGLTEPPAARVIQISNTLHLAEVICSEAYLPELASRVDLQRTTEVEPMRFDANGNLFAVLGTTAAGH